MSVSIILIMGVQIFILMQETNMVKPIFLRYMFTVFPYYTLSLTIMNSGGSGGVHKRFKNVQALGVIIVL